MCDPVTLTIAAVGIAGAGVSAYQGQQQAKETKKANQQAKEASDKQLAIAEQEINKKDARNPDISSISAGNQSGDNSTSTMLTGAAGVDPTKLLLGKNTLLGG
jgi:hypothetical protein